VGAAQLRPGAPSDAVDGIVPGLVVEPGTAETLAEVLACAARSGLAVVPRGGGTKLHWGNPPARADLLLDTRRLDRVVEHAWGDMTATVEAGCTVARLQQTLAEHGQRLAIDALWRERATIGGMLATNDSGPLRARFGSLRDLLIGVTLALPDGTLAKSGGKVVKNVAGYDLPKLAIGSFGTLAVITQAVFRLHPLPHDTRAVTFTAPTVEPLCALALAIQASPLAFLALQLRTGATGTAALDVEFEGTGAGLDAQQQQVMRLAGSLSTAAAPAAVWRAPESLWEGAPSGVVGKLSVLPTRLADCCATVRQVSESHGLGWGLVALALGLGQVRLAGGSGATLVTGLERLRAGVEALGGTLVLLSGPREVKARFDVWGSSGDALQLMQRVKQQLDPGAVLNPGRFVGGI
jgi:glycolate oxidase FAD binding subunit